MDKKQPVTKKDVITIMREFVSRQFPKECPCCGRQFNSLADYIHNTTRQGKMASYGAEQVEWNPEKPIGAIAMANCSCGTTLSVGSKGMDPETLWKLAEWVRKEKNVRGVAIEDVLEEIRFKVIEETLLENLNKTK